MPERASSASPSVIFVYQKLFKQFYGLRHKSLYHPEKPFVRTKQGQAEIYNGHGIHGVFGH